ncbi:MAG: hypothetical protein MI757_02415 [Pirellulales bacterium]|nr:hypothetical protein [Pirellulales bacterium]
MARRRKYDSHFPTDRNFSRDPAARQLKLDRTAGETNPRLRFVCKGCGAGERQGRQDYRAHPE